MKYSVCLSVSPAKFDAVPFKNGFETDVHTIARLGFDGVELAIRDPRLIDQESILETVDRLQLGISAIGTGQAWGEEGLSYTDPDPAIRRKAIERTCSHFPFAQKARAVVIIGLLRGTGKPGVSERQLDEWMYAAFSECCADAEANGIKIAFEPLNRYETSLLNTVEEGLSFIDKIGSASLGMLLDTFHMNIEEASIEESLKLANTRMFHLHYADSNRNYPGCGHLDFASILQVVRDLGYQGYVSGEHRAYPAPEIAALRGLSYLKELEKAMA